MHFKFWIICKFSLHSWECSSQWRTKFVSEKLTRIWNSIKTDIFEFPQVVVPKTIWAASTCFFFCNFYVYIPLPVEDVSTSAFPTCLGLLVLETPSLLLFIVLLWVTQKYQRQLLFLPVTLPQGNSWWKCKEQLEKMIWNLE